MNILAVCSCALLAITVAHAAPQFGYHYERNNLNNNNQNLKGKDAESFFNAAPVGNSFALPNPQKGGDGGFGGNKYLPPATTTPAPIITKQFFLVSAPDESEETPKTKHFVIGRPQKNYRVVFIKAPGSENTNLRLTAEYAPQEEKTVIYVLSKKDNELTISDIATPAPTQPTKPEVFFIKYKTQEEAAAAQKEIQEQYDHLGGTSEFTDEGVVPVKSVIGSLDGLAANGGYDYKKVQNGANSAIKDFLQPARFYF